jgi:hypothetical protein
LRLSLLDHERAYRLVQGRQTPLELVK